MKNEEKINSKPEIGTNDHGQEEEQADEEGEYEGEG